jgi:hypothetical protein
MSAGDSNTAVTAGGEADAPVDSGLPAAAAPAEEDSRRQRRPWEPATVDGPQAGVAEDDDRMAAIVRRARAAAAVGACVRLLAPPSRRGAPGAAVCARVCACVRILCAYARAEHRLHVCPSRAQRRP